MLNSTLKGFAGSTGTGTMSADLRDVARDAVSTYVGREGFRAVWLGYCCFAAVHQPIYRPGAEQHYANYSTLQAGS